MYKIEITADTLSELAGKAMSLAAKLNTGTVTEAVVKGATPVKTVEVAPEVAEEASAPLPSAGQTEAPPAIEHTETPSTSVPTEPSAGAEEKTPAPSASELNFDTDIAPLVLQVVKDKGKPVAQAILSQFGVEKASTLDTARWPELIAALQDAL